MGLLFLYASLDLRVQHSFPTRRSSDLLVETDVVEFVCFDDARVGVRVGSFFRDGDRLQVRSEEHTSELQSRRDLVCRLLLEKKKKRTILITDNVSRVRFALLVLWVNRA